MKSYCIGHRHGTVGSCTNYAVQRLEQRLLLAGSAVLVKDIIPGPDSSVILSQLSAALGSTLVFAAADETHGLEPWVSDGTSGGTVLLKDINPAGSSDPFSPAVVGNTLYFIASNGTTRDIWQTDGTPAGTKKAASATDPASQPASLAVIDGQLLFFTSISGDANELWRFAANGTSTLIGSGFHGASILGMAGSKLLFQASDAVHGGELWETDGSTSSFVADIEPGTGASSISEGRSFNGVFYFRGGTTASGSEVWRSDGTPGGTRMVQSIRAGAATADPRELTVSGGKLYFTADDGAGYQIWRTDGASAVKVTSLDDTGFSFSLGGLVDVNGTLFFGYGPGGVSRKLYKLAGGITPTAVGTDVMSSPVLSSPANRTAIGSTLYFSATAFDSKVRLFSSDGTSVSAALESGAGFDQYGLINVNGSLFYQADDPAHGTELHAILGAPAVKPFKVKLKANHVEINEGGSISFSATVTGGKATKYVWDYADGPTVQGVKASTAHKYEQNLASDAERTVKVTAYAKGGLKASAKIKITVKNVKPTITIFVPAAFVTYAPMPWKAVIKDPGKDLDGCKVSIIWGDEDFISGLTPDKNGEIGGVQVFSKLQIDLKNVRFEVVDHDGAADTVLTTLVIGDVKRLLPSSVNDVLGLYGVYVGGTSGNDRQKLQRAPKQKAKRETLTFTTGSGQQTLSLDKGEPIHVYLGPGNDRLDIAADVLHGVYVSGGTGKDTMIGGAGNDTLLGEGGTDKVSGGGGNNSLKA